jgi:hypothetical protein
MCMEKCKKAGSADSVGSAKGRSTPRQVDVSRFWLEFFSDLNTEISEREAYKRSEPEKRRFLGALKSRKA